MPIFEYSCDDCGTRFEKLIRRTGESEGVRCPSCGENHLTTEYSTFAARSGSKSAPSTEGCGTGMCGANACMGGMCGMDMN